MNSKERERFQQEQMKKIAESIKANREYMQTYEAKKQYEKARKGIKLADFNSD